MKTERDDQVDDAGASNVRYISDFAFVVVAGGILAASPVMHVLTNSPFYREVCHFWANYGVFN